jgi:hypothetical protein
MQGLAIGTHRVVAYEVIGGRPGSTRVARSLAFRIVAGPGATEYPAHRPDVCIDPLRELSGT